MKICIDAGHYDKYNKSPVNSSYWESYFTWDFHKLLKAELEKYGVTVVVTRPNQKNDLGLEARGRKSQGCDLFLSIHSNACDSEPVDYPLACCTVSHKVDDLGKRLADTVARVMETNQNGRIINKSQGDGRDWYGVLRGATTVGTPGILLEHSFHTNKKATNWLLDRENQKKMAEAEAETIAKYYGLTKSEQEAPKDESKPVEPAKPATPSTPESYLVKVICNALNVRQEPIVKSGNVNTIIRMNEVYTIVETKNGWGRLKSGAGWICLDPRYVTKVK